MDLTRSLPAHTPDDHPSRWSWTLPGNGRHRPGRPDAIPVATLLHTVPSSRTLARHVLRAVPPAGVGVALVFALAASATPAGPAPGFLPPPAGPQVPAPPLPPVAPVVPLMVAPVPVAAEEPTGDTAPPADETADQPADPAPEPDPSPTPDTQPEPESTPDPEPSPEPDTSSTCEGSS